MGGKQKMSTACEGLERLAEIKATLQKLEENAVKQRREYEETTRTDAKACADAALKGESAFPDVEFLARLKIEAEHADTVFKMAVQAANAELAKITGKARTEVFDYATELEMEARRKVSPAVEKARAALNELADILGTNAVREIIMNRGIGCELREGFREETIGTMGTVQALRYRLSDSTETVAVDRTLISPGSAAPAYNREREIDPKYERLLRAIADCELVPVEKEEVSHAN